MKPKNILIIGADLTSNGGIASVIKTYNNAFLKGNYPFKMFFLKTSYYKDKPKIYAIEILAKSIIRFFYFVVFKNIGLLHIHSSSNISFLRKSIFVILGKIFNKKIVLHIHASKFYEYFMSNNQFLTKYIAFIFSLCNVVVVLCEDWKKKLINKYPTINVKKIVNPIVLPEKFKVINSPKSDKFTLLFVGFLIESKGIKDLLKLALLLKTSNVSDVKFIIAGKGELENYILQFIEKEQLQNIVEYIGWINGKDKDLLYLKADVFVLPSYKEGMPISVLEAMSYGLPILSTNIAGLPDIIKNNINGFLFSPGDIKTLYDKIIFLKNDTSFINIMSKNNLECIQDFSADKIFEKVLDTYREYI